MGVRNEKTPARFRFATIKNSAKYYLKFLHTSVEFFTPTIADCRQPTKIDSQLKRQPTKNDSQLQKTNLSLREEFKRGLATIGSVYLAEILFCAGSPLWRDGSERTEYIFVQSV